jgi:hypothetical protein
MRNRTLFALIITVIITAFAGCSKGGKNNTASTEVNSQSMAGMILIGKDIITDIIIKPDTLGDPWEVEKVKGFAGNQMFNTIFEKIHNKELTVYDCLSGEPLTPEKVKEMEKEYNLDIKKIGKIQYLEDWYFNPATNNIVKKIKATSFGYESIRGDGLSIGYRPLFQIRTE